VKPAAGTAARQSMTPQWVPWTDKKGRFDPLRAVTLGILLLPAAWLALRFALGMMGARPLNAAIHSTGYWAVSGLIASLMITPAKAIFGMPGIVVLRRLIGNAALAYAGLHLALYCADQNWKVLTIITEIVQRFYLTIGFVALVGLAVLGVTSTDKSIRRMGARWKRLHKLVYGLAVLSLVHFILQTKADVSLPLLFVGVFIWLMIWRSMPVGKDRTFGGLAAVSAMAAVLTLGAEWLWYALGTHIDPIKVVVAETDVSFGLGPADQVALAGAGVLLALWIRRLSQGSLGTKAAFWVVSFALAAAIDEVVTFAFGIDRFIEPGDWTFLFQDLAWAAVLGMLGFVRWRSQTSTQRRMVDGLAVCCVALQIMVSDGSLRLAEMIVAVGVGILCAVLTWQTWRQTKMAAVAFAALILVIVQGVMSQV
ncbi:MAG: sulfite oxidase heme-binding subunit YedZ, partial [Janthinobacterium lividum]